MLLILTRSFSKRFSKRIVSLNKAVSRILSEESGGYGLKNV